MQTLRVASLFAGCGGTDIGLMGGFSYLEEHYQAHPVSLVYANDFDAGACDLFDENFSIKIDRSDIRHVDTSCVPQYDLLTAGFPCQSFSIVAQNPPRLGIHDSDKGTLFEEVCRFLRDHQPRGFICENVKGILSSNKGQAFPLILESLRACGYYVTHLLLNANAYGIPQRRERVFIVGFKEKQVFDAFRAPIAQEKHPTLGDVVLDAEEIPEKYYFSEKAVAGMKAAKKEMNKGRVQSLDKPCATVGAHLAKVSLNSTDPVLKTNGKYRRFTPREVARIQSFPESYQLTGPESRQYKALGNAIPPVLAWHVMKSVVEALECSTLNDGVSPSIETSDNRSNVYSSHSPVQLMLFEPEAMYVVCQTPLTLKATYRKSCRDWIVENNLYNYPVTDEELKQHAEFNAVKRIILQNGKDVPLYFSVTKVEGLVSKKELKELGYPANARHRASTRYILYKLNPLKSEVPQFDVASAYIIGKGIV